MDFLLLLSDRVRVVLEIDGKHHYADGEIASPKRYSEMAEADRDLQLAGYEVYRFGGHELLQEDAEQSARRTTTAAVLQTPALMMIVTAALMIMQIIPSMGIAAVPEQRAAYARMAQVQERIASLLLP